MSGQISGFEIGDEVNVKYSNRWHRENGNLVIFHIANTRHTTNNGRVYFVRENGDEFSENEIRVAQN